MLEKILPEDLLKKIEDKEELLILDVRSEEKYNEYHIKNEDIENLNIPKNKIFELDEGEEDTVTPLLENKQVIVTCTTGNSATRCTEILARKGCNVKVLEGGITAWKEIVGE